jgi:hypothetical protein
MLEYNDFGSILAFGLVGRWTGLGGMSSLAALVVLML